MGHPVVTAALARVLPGVAVPEAAARRTVRHVALGLARLLSVHLGIAHVIPTALLVPGTA